MFVSLYPTLKMPKYLWLHSSLANLNSRWLNTCLSWHKCFSLARLCTFNVNFPRYFDVSKSTLTGHKFCDPLRETRKILDFICFIPKIIVSQTFLYYIFWLEWNNAKKFKELNIERHIELKAKIQISQ